MVFKNSVFSVMPTPGPSGDALVMVTMLSSVHRCQTLNYLF